MGSFEWMELQTLTSDINASRSRLAAARANKDNRLVRLLEAEITEAEARRDRLLASITSNLAGGAEPAQNPPAKNSATETSAPVVETPVTEPAAKQPVADEPAAEERAAAESAAAEEPAVRAAEAPAAETRAAPVLPAAQGDSAEGDMIVWDQLTPADIERAQGELGKRREEMLARHAEELKALEAEQAELEGLEKAISAFVQRLNRPPSATSEAA